MRHGAGQVKDDAEAVGSVANAASTSTIGAAALRDRLAAHDGIEVWE